MRKKKILDAAKELLNWLENNPNASEKEIEAKKREFNDKVSEIVENAEARKGLDDYVKNLNNRLDNDKTLTNNISEEEKKIHQRSIKRFGKI